MWYEHPGPVGLDDAGWYMSNIEYFREFPFITRGSTELTSPPIYNINKISHPLLFGWLAFVFGTSAETMYHINFYVGIVLMGFVLVALFRRIDASPWFVLSAFVLFAFYEGKGSYHGFSWVVPSFYAIALFLSGIVVFFFSQRPILYGFLVILLLLLTHSTGIYLASILLLSYMLNESVCNRNGKPLIAGFILSGIVVSFFLIGEYLYFKKMIPASITLSFQSYHKGGFAFVEGWGDRFIVAMQAIYKTVNMYDFNKYFYGLYTPLVGYGLFELIRKRKYPIVWLFVLLFAGLIIASPLARFPMRFFYPLEVVTWIMIAYGISVNLKRLFGNSMEELDSVKSGCPKLTQRVIDIGIIVIAVLFLYNAIHQKSDHITYVKYSNVRFFDKERLIEIMEQNPDKRFVVFTKMRDVYLSYDGMWQNPQLLFPEKSDPETIAQSPSDYIFIAENHRYLDENKRGEAQVFVPDSASIWLSVEGLKPGRYRLEMIDTGLSRIDDIQLFSGESVFSSWQVDDYPVRFPDEGMTPPVLPPWYWQHDKPWLLKKRPIRRDNVARMAKRHSCEFRIERPLEIITLLNYDGDLSLNGIIRIVDLDRGGSRVFDLYWGDERVLKNDLGMIYEGKRYPLLWSGAYPGMLMTLEKNFRDVKAFSFHSLGWPVQ
ncbi:hypothetical protein [Chlorobaculum limnaeum]|nr:hypothetical protein [Chlorobaculum limnaeum]